MKSHRKINSKTKKKCELLFYYIFEFWFRILKVEVLSKLKFMEYHVIYAIYICWKFHNHLTFFMKIWVHFYVHTYKCC